MSAYPKISLIIPVYNAAPFLEESIRSTLKQTLNEIQVIVVNDGSSDGSTDILNRLQSEDKRLVVVHTANQGVSNARNKGLELADAEWVGFLDADDWLSIDMYSKMYEAALHNDADWVICNASVHQAGNITDRLSLSDACLQVDADKSSLIGELIDFRYDFANWNKLYRREIIAANNLSFSDKLFIGEDLLFNLEYALHVSSISTIAESLYHYRIHDESVMSRRETEKLSQYNSILLLFGSVCNNTRNQNAYLTLRKKMQQGVYNSIIPSLCSEASKNTVGLTAYMRYFGLKMEKLSDEILDFPAKDMIGFQGFKKWLLKNRYFKIFAFFTYLQQKRRT